MRSIWNFILVASFFLITPMYAMSGNMGGGGTPRDPLVLTPKEKIALQKQQDEQAAFQKWVQSMDETKEMQVLQKVFEQHILPQIR